VNSSQFVEEVISIRVLGVVRILFRVLSTGEVGIID
jgi:hypothetical protein